MLCDIISDYSRSSISTVSYVNSENEEVVISNDVMLRDAIAHAGTGLLAVFAKNDIAQPTVENHPDVTSTPNCANHSAQKVDTSNNAVNTSIDEVNAPIDVSHDIVNTIGDTRGTPTSGHSHPDVGKVDTTNNPTVGVGDAPIEHSSNVITTTTGAQDIVNANNLAVEVDADESMGTSVQEPSSPPTETNDSILKATPPATDLVEQISLMQRRLADLHYLNLAETTDELGVYGLDTMLAVFHFRLAHNEDLLVGVDECDGFDEQVADAVELVWRFETGN